MSMKQNHSHARHEYDHGHDDHAHTHGAIDPSILTSDRGIWAIKWSFIVLMITALFQIVIVWISGSIALLADTIHNFADAATAIPLGIAFMFGRLKPSKRFTYGYGRVEDLAGVAVVLMILGSATVAGYESVVRLFHPKPVSHLLAVIIASIIGFIGNEAVAVFRIKVGKEIGSAALVADGYHARVDGFTSLAVLVGAVGVWLGFPLADPIAGLIITAVLVKVVWDSIKLVFVRLLDGVEPEVIEEIKHSIGHISLVKGITEVRARWIGHFIHAEVNVTVNPSLSVEQGHDVAREVKNQIKKHSVYVSNVIVHVDPLNASGEHCH